MLCSTLQWCLHNICATATAASNDIIVNNNHTLLAAKIVRLSFHRDCDKNFHLGNTKLESAIMKMLIKYNIHS